MKHAAASSLDQGLELWFTQARAINAPVSGAVAIEKADSWQERFMNISERDLLWLDRSKKRTGIVYQSVHGELCLVYENVVKTW